MSPAKSRDVASIIGTLLPFLRRYARALTGSQDTGDQYAAAQHQSAKNLLHQLSLAFLMR